jgi:hypothetical protein
MTWLYDDNAAKRGLRRARSGCVVRAMEKMTQLEKVRSGRRRQR